ncbi:hypothetical protein QBC47DRAFT_389690, partial [Echria macrotheca]
GDLPSWRTGRRTLENHFQPEIPRKWAATTAEPDPRHELPVEPARASHPRAAPAEGSTPVSRVRLPPAHVRSSQKCSLILNRWLNSVYVRGSWYEFQHDFLSHSPLAPEPDKAKIAQLAKDAVNSRSQKYLVYHPDKTGWTSEDHHVRFIVTLVSDNLLKNMWSESEWKKRGVEIAKAGYEVLSFLRATFAAGVDVNPPRYAD